MIKKYFNYKFKEFSLTLDTLVSKMKTTNQILESNLNSTKEILGSKVDLVDLPQELP